MARAKRRPRERPSDQKPEAGQAFLKTLSPEQKQAYVEACRFLDNPASTLGWHFDLGQQLLALVQRAGYGASRVNELARALALSRVRVYQHLQFVERYPSRQEVEALGMAGLCWAGVVALLGVRYEGDRAHLQREAVAQRWSVDRLRIEIRKLNRLRWGTRGRRGADAQDGKAQLARLDDATAAWLAAEDEFTPDGEGSFRLLGQELRGPGATAVRARLNALLDSLGSLQERAREMHARLRSLLAAHKDG